MLYLRKLHQRKRKRLSAIAHLPTRTILHTDTKNRHNHVNVDTVI